MLYKKHTHGEVRKSIVRVRKVAETDDLQALIKQYEYEVRKLREIAERIELRETLVNVSDGLYSYNETDALSNDDLKSEIDNCTDEAIKIVATN